MFDVKVCERCPLRTKYDNKPRSLVGRFWRWHIDFCPGWKKYYASLNDQEREDITSKYNYKR